MPTVEQIMGRVLVSHDFLGANFENFLINQDPDGDFRRLLGGVTAIVIGSARASEFLHGRYRRDLPRRQQPVADPGTARRGDGSAGLPFGLRRPAQLHRCGPHGQE
ncbi:hypothetical protein LP419_08630 [Massilia sp. H-1]|nr:hypothetical protein LP419_08630 [Massilia sp. H-1]